MKAEIFKTKTLMIQDPDPDQVSDFQEQDCKQVLRCLPRLKSWEFQAR